MKPPPGFETIELDGREVEFSQAAGRVRVGGESARLTAREATIFAKLAKGDVVPGLNAVAVTRIRKKIEPLGLAVMSLHGQGRYFAWASPQ